jgi:hypothetical protein
MTTSHQLVRAQRIAESIVGPAEWKGEEAWINCPGVHRHTKPNAPTDCKVVCAPVPLDSGVLAPGIYCHHKSCRAEVGKLTNRLRSTLGHGVTGLRGALAPRAAAGRTPRPRMIEPEFDPGKLEAIARKLPRVDEQWFALRSKLPVDAQTIGTFLQQLYAPGERVIIFDEFKSQGQDVWQHDGVIIPPYEPQRFRKGKLRGVWILCNPVTGQFVPDDKLNEDGTPHLTRRSWRTITAWRYLVLESDEAAPAQWLSALAQLPLPISAIYTSGGKSIHALVRLDARSKADWDAQAAQINPIVIPLGADPGAISGVRLTRLPCCERLGTDDKNGNYVRYLQPRLQKLLYLNPTPDSTPICELEVLR